MARKTCITSSNRPPPCPVWLLPTGASNQTHLGREPGPAGFTGQQAPPQGPCTGSALSLEHACPHPPGAFPTCPLPLAILLTSLPCPLRVSRLRLVTSLPSPRTPGPRGKTRVLVDAACAASRTGRCSGHSVSREQNCGQNESGHEKAPGTFNPPAWFRAAFCWKGHPAKELFARLFLAGKEISPQPN